MDASDDSTHTGNGNGHKPHDPQNDSLPPVEAPGSSPGAPVESSKPIETSAGAPSKPLAISFDQDPPTPPSKPRRSAKLKREQIAFLRAISNGLLSKTAAAKAAKVTRQTFYNWMDAVDKEGNPTPNCIAFRAAFAQAQEEGTDKYLDHARKVSLIGWYEPVFDKAGRQCGRIWKYDSKVLQLMLQRLDPSFRLRHEITGANGAPFHPDKVEHTVKYDFSGLDADEVNDLYRKLSRSRVLPSTGN